MNPEEITNVIVTHNLIPCLPVEIPEALAGHGLDLFG